MSSISEYYAKKYSDAKKDGFQKFNEFNSNPMSHQDFMQASSLLNAPQKNNLPYSEPSWYNQPNSIQPSSIHTQPQQSIPQFGYGAQPVNRNKYNDFSNSNFSDPSPYPYPAEKFQQHTLLQTNFYPMGNIGQPETQSTPCAATSNDDYLLNEPPLLEELGIHPDCIMRRMWSAICFYRVDHDLLSDVDMCGPLFIAGCLGACLLLNGKIHFGYIYGLSVTGSLGLYSLLNLMSQKHSIDVYKTVSILGYGLLPAVGLAATSIFFSLRSVIGLVLSGITVLWCTAIASRFFEAALEMTHQRFLVAYPILILYGCFVLITVF